MEVNKWELLVEFVVVNEGMAAYEEDISSRREKLRGIIVAEEAALTKEIIDEAERSEDVRLEEIRAEAAELRKREEENRMAIVAAKRMQQYLARCPEARDNLTKKWTLDTKHCNLVQMREKSARVREERELDALWHRLMLKEVEAKKLRESEEAKRKVATGREVTATLKKQIAGKLALAAEENRVKEEQREFLEHLWENVRKEEVARLERERERRANLKKELEDQLMIAKRSLAERAREEARIDRLLASLTEEELARERAQIAEASKSLREEMLAYLKYLEELREDEARRNAEVEAIVEQSSKDARARRDLAVRKFKESRERILQEVLKGREQQLREKREAELREKEQLEAERQLFLKEIELDTELTACEEKNKREKALKYGRELKAQQKYVEAARCREIEENERIYRRGMQREEEYQALTGELVNASEIVAPHPFKIVLLESAARRAAERSGLCYCPPALPQE